MADSTFRQIDIDDAEPGVMLYDSDLIPIGCVRNYLAMNGNGPPIPERHLDDGNPKHRFAYIRKGMYRRAKQAAMGKVFVRRALVPVGPEKEPA